MKKITAILAVAVLIISARGQGVINFLNLNFESVQNLPGNPGEGISIPVTDALPDWAAYNDGSALADIYYVSNSLGDVSGSVELEGGSLALSGDFSVGLYSNGSIRQTAMVPANSESLEFEATSPGEGMYITLGGQTLSYSEISEDSGYDVYAANIPADLDGQTETLIFGMQGIGQTLLDGIEFNIPEPGEMSLVSLGVVLFGVFNAKARRRC